MNDCANTNILSSVHEKYKEESKVKESFITNNLHTYLRIERRTIDVIYHTHLAVLQSLILWIIGLQFRRGYLRKRPTCQCCYQRQMLFLQPLYHLYLYYLLLPSYGRSSRCRVLFVNFICYHFLFSDI